MISNTIVANQLKQFKVELDAQMDDEPKDQAIVKY
jgi:hypothetical protein